MVSILISKDAKVAKGELRSDKLLLVTRKIGLVNVISGQRFSLYQYFHGVEYVLQV